MVVAVVPVRVVQVTIHQVVDMVAVRDGLVTAARAVHVVRVVALAGVPGRAARGVLVAHIDRVLVDVTVVVVVQVTVVEVVHVVSVLHGDMPAAGVMLVVVVLVLVAAHVWVFLRLGRLGSIFFLGVLEHTLHQLGNVMIGQ